MDFFLKPQAVFGWFFEKFLKRYRKDGESNLMYTTDLTGVKLTLKEFKNEAMESTISSLSTIDTLFQMVSEAPVRLVYNAQSERLRASNDQGRELYEQSLEFMRTHSCRGFRFPTTLDPEQVTFGKLCSLV